MKRNLTTRADVDLMLKIFAEQGGSDLHIITNRKPIFRIKGRLIEQDGWGTLHKEETDHLIALLSDEATRASVLAGNDVDFGYRPQRDTQNFHAAKYRVNICNELNGTRIVMRRITAIPPKVDNLMLPPACTEAVHTIRRGLILVTGPTGSGKSASFAAWIGDLVEKAENEHILTIEDPIEYEYSHVKALHGTITTQREKGTDFKDFGTAMRSALRQDPDIIMVGELRDKETIDLALQAADSGHLVLATVHSNNVAGTISRLISCYEPTEQEVVADRLLSTVAMIMTQRLEPRKDGKGRLALHEYLVITPAMKDDLRTTKNLKEIYTRMQYFVEYSGQTMLSCAFDRYRKGLISAQTYNKVAASLQSPDRIYEPSPPKDKQEAGV